MGGKAIISAAGLQSTAKLNFFSSYYSRVRCESIIGCVIMILRYFDE